MEVARKSVLGKVRLSGMRELVAISRNLVLFLLALRMLASPLAMRPEPHQLASNYRLVARVCAWPAQHPQRSLSRTSLFASLRGNDPRHADVHGLDFRGHLTSAEQTALPLSNPKALSPGRQSVCLRC